MASGVHRPLWMRELEGTMAGSLEVDVGWDGIGRGNELTFPCLNDSGSSL